MDPLPLDNFAHLSQICNLRLPIRLHYSTTMTTRDKSGLLWIIMAILFSVHQAAAWDYEGHYVINQLALASLPTNFPAFVFASAARERIAFLSGEPDRWRNVPDLPLKQDNGPDHYIDLEELNHYGMTPDTLPSLRYDFVGQLAVFRAMHADQFPLIDPVRDAAHTGNLVGFLPWTITEYTARLKSAFSYLKAYQEAGGSSNEIVSAQENIIYLMGVMGHFVGDGSQPLHTTIHFNGWVGSNPHGYTTNHAFHSWIDGGYFRKTGGLKVETMLGKIRPAEHVVQPAQTNGIFRVAVAYLAEQNTLVQPLYQLEKDGKLSGEGENGLTGRAFLEMQLVKGGQMLGNIWLTAWLDAPEDVYLKNQLKTRNSSDH
jgi:hypothetical protein